MFKSLKPFCIFKITKIKEINKNYNDILVKNFKIKNYLKINY